MRRMMLITGAPVFIEYAADGDSLPVVRRCMLEMIYVARSCGLTDAMLPLALVDQTIQMTYKTCACPSRSTCSRLGTRLSGRDVNPA